MKITFEIPEASVERLESAYEGKDPELAEYLASSFPVVLRDLNQGRVEAELTRRGNPLRTIEHLCCCFHLFSKKLRERHEKRSTLEVTDEYDVQDLLNALLFLHFNDVRKEEAIPSHAGKCARADFLLKQEKIIIEVKKISAHLRESELHDQLLVDIQHYQEHPQCETLVCFVYDPDCILKNPDGIENDLSRVIDGFRVKTIVSPKGY